MEASVNGPRLANVSLANRNLRSLLKSNELVEPRMSLDDKTRKILEFVYKVLVFENRMLTVGDVAERVLGINPFSNGAAMRRQILSTEGRLQEGLSYVDDLASRGLVKIYDRYYMSLTVDGLVELIRHGSWVKNGASVKALSPYEQNFFGIFGKH